MSMPLYQLVFNLVECIAKERLDLSKEGFHDLFNEVDPKFAAKEAAVYGKIGLMYYLIHEKGVDVNTIYSGRRPIRFKKSNFPRQKDEQKTLLIYTIMNHQREMALFLLNIGADPNIPDENNVTPLMFASMEGYTDLVLKLIDKGADINARSIYGDTALMHAVYKGYLDIARILLKCGAIVEPKQGDSWTPLMHAAEKGRLDIAKLLLEYGANVNAKKGYFKETALMLALGNGHIKLAKFLIEHGADIAINFDELGGSTVLQIIDKKLYLKTNQFIERMQELVSDFFDAIKKEDLSILQNMLQKNPWLINACISGIKARDLAKKQGIDLDTLLDNIRTKQEGILSQGTIKKPGKWKRIKKTSKKVV